jgi:deoxyhypusine synthase
MFCPPYMMKNIGIAVPTAYESVMKTASRVTVPVIANEMTEAKIGPTHGVHRRPSESPTNTPLQ